MSSKIGLTAARSLALDIIKLATGRPEPGALLIAHDYRFTLLKLHSDVLGAVGAEDARLFDIAVSLVRAAYDAQRKGHADPSHYKNYRVRLDDAFRAMRWATSYVARVNPHDPGAMVLRTSHDAAGIRELSLNAHVMDAVIHQAVLAQTDEANVVPPRAYKDRRSPISIYSRMARGPEMRAPMISRRA